MLIFRSTHHDNVSFTDEKVFVLKYLLKQRLRRDSITRNAPQMFIPSEVNSHKRHNVACSIRPLRTSNSVKTSRCTITEENGTDEMFQRCKNFLVHIKFLVPGDMAVCDNITTHVKGVNSHLKQAMKSIGIDVMTLPKCSPDLSPIELTLNDVIQRLNSELN